MKTLSSCVLMSGAGVAFVSGIVGGGSMCLVIFQGIGHVSLAVSAAFVVGYCAARVPRRRRISRTKAGGFAHAIPA